MNLDEKEMTIVGFIVTWIYLIFGIGRSTGKNEKTLETVGDRVSDLENEKYVTEKTCLERKGSCEKTNKIQFDAGSVQFAELKKLIAENDRASNERHSEIMKYLMDMNR